MANLVGMIVDRTISLLVLLLHFAYELNSNSRGPVLQPDQLSGGPSVYTSTHLTQLVYFNILQERSQPSVVRKQGYQIVNMKPTAMVVLRTFDLTAADPVGGFGNVGLDGCTLISIGEGCWLGYKLG